MSLADGRRDDAREPFGPTTIDDRTMPARDPRLFGARSDVRTLGALPMSGGPLPPRDRIPAELNIGTALDEQVAWAHEHDRATNELELLREQLVGVEIAVMKARAKARRVARANPTARGRRTSGDIDAEVEEVLASLDDYHRKLDLETGVEVQMGRLFRAKDNLNRLQHYIDTLPRYLPSGV